MKKLILILFVFLYGCCGVVEQKSHIEKKIVQFKLGRAEGGSVCSDGYKFLVINDTWHGGVTAIQIRNEDGKFVKCYDY